jgi:peptidyl-prolyl cis-trans isomerase B (cyclophilin B)
LLAGCGGTKHAAPPKPAAGNGCSQVDMPITGTRNTDPPTQKLNPKKTYDVTMVTNCGSFTIRVDPTESPSAAASFVWLVKNLFYYTTIFHRIDTGILIQGGDPTGTGTGGPGYSTSDKVPKTAKYTHGVVAMAKTGAEPAGTAGSQFFIVTAANAGLDPDYAIIGKVVKGLNVVDRIGQLGNADETPKQIVELLSANLAITG